MQDILIVVDMQNDFVDGSLGTQEAQQIVERVEEKIRQFEGRVLYTKDTHESDYLETQEGMRSSSSTVSAARKAGNSSLKLKLSVSRIIR